MCNAEIKRPEMMSQLGQKQLTQVKAAEQLELRGLQHLRIRLYQPDNAVDGCAGGIDRERKVHQRAAAQWFE